MEPLLHLAIIWLGVFISVFLARRTKLTPVLYFLAVGAVLVNLGILPLEPHPFIRGFGEIGMILIMFALGFEESTSNFLQSIKRAWGIALFGALGPFLTAFAVARLFFGDVNLALMFGLTMTATAVSLTMVSLRSEGLARSKAAGGIMTSAVIDSISSLAMLAILIPIATGRGPANLSDIGLILGKAIVFFAIVGTIGAWVLPHERGGFARRFPRLNRIGLMHILAAGEGEHATLTVLLFAVSVGLLAHAFGFHPAVGAYMAGLVIKEEYFDFLPRPKESAYLATKRIVDNVAFSWIGPVFFVDLGTKIVFDWTTFVSVIPETAVLLGAMVIAQVGSAALAARYTGAFAWPEAIMIGFGMLGRAELAFVVMDIAYVENRILTDAAFFTLMFTCFWLNVAVPVTIRWWKPYYEGEKALFGAPG